MKKLLAIITAAVMLVGMMGTVAMAEDAPAAKLVIQMTTANVTSGVIVEHSSGGWTKTAAATIPAYFQVNSNNIGRYLKFYPQKAGLNPGIYACYQITRPFEGTSNWTTPMHRFDFYGTSGAAKGTAFVAVGANGSSKDTYTQYIGTYTFNGTAGEYIKYGFPTTVSDNARLFGLQFVPITSQSVTKNYTVTKNQTLTMAIDIDAMGEGSGLTYAPTAESCEAMVGSVITEGNKFTYVPETDYVGKDSFVLTATLNGCTIALTVNLEVVDDNAIYFDDADGEDISSYVYNNSTTGFNGGHKYFNGNSGFTWNITGIDAGVYEVLYYKTIGDDAADPSLSLELTHNGCVEKLGISGLNDGREGWESIGVFDFAGDGEEKLSVRRKNTSQYYFGHADAIKLVPVSTTLNKEIKLFANDVYKESVLLTYDREDSDLSPVSASAPSNGTAVIEGGSVIYTPNSDYTGEDSFSVECGGGYTVNYTVKVSAVPQTLTAERGNDNVTVSGTTTTEAIGATGISYYSQKAGAYMKWAIPAGTASGYYQVSVWKMAQNWAKATAQMEIISDGGNDTDLFVQKGLSSPARSSAVGAWVPVGIYYFEGNGEESIKMIDRDTPVAATLNKSSGTINSKQELLRMGGFKMEPVTSMSDAAVGNVTFTAENASTTLSSLPDAARNVTSDVKLTNKTAQGEAVTVINTIFNNGKLVSATTEKQYVKPYSAKKLSAVAKVAAPGTDDDYQIKTFIWDSETLKPVLETPAVLN